MEAHHQTSRFPKPNTLVTSLVVKLIRGYQLCISPLIGPRCRFYPSCSCYSIQAFQTHGLVQGTWLSLSRVCKCHPFHPGGIDPVPSPNNQSQ